MSVEESLENPLRAAESELRRAYAALYPPLPDATIEDSPTASFWGGMYARADIDALRRTEELLFSVYFRNSEPWIFIENPNARASITLAGNDGSRLFSKLTPQGRRTFIQHAADTGNIILTEDNKSMKDPEKIAKSVRMMFITWSQKSSEN